MEKLETRKIALALEEENRSRLCRKNISKREHPHRDLSTALRFGRDDKGGGLRSNEE